MSEAELHLIRQRMLSGKLAKAERGELAVPLPIGYVRRPSGEVNLRPPSTRHHRPQPRSAIPPRPPAGRGVGTCTCVCTSGGFCGGCGHAGRGRR